MTGIQMALAIATIIVSILLIILVLLQKNDQTNASAVMGGGDSSFFDKTRGHKQDATLANITKVLGVIFAILALATTGVLIF